MSDEDCEIEYLDEDEDIVQQCVQTPQSTVPTVADVFTLNTQEDLEEKIVPLLIERKPAAPKRKIKEEEEDSDYDPSQDIQPPDSPPRKKKKPPSKKAAKTTTPVQQKPKAKLVETPVSLKKVPITTVQTVVRKVIREDENLDERRKLDIKIPDYEDPLCLPVRALKKDNQDWRTLRIWNNRCLEVFKRADMVLKADSGKTKGSTRTVVLRNVKNKSGKIETTVWGKTYVESVNKARKSEVYQCVLPLYREKKIIKSYNLGPPTGKLPTHHKYEVLLTKEGQREEEVLVAYKPNEGISAVYKGYQQKSMEGSEDPYSRMGMKEITCSKLCAPCYQTSWRGIRRSGGKDEIKCKICGRTYISVYNLLSHLKTHHNNEQVRKYKSHLARSLASVVDYHYKCRICQEQFLSIKLLRTHIKKHKSAHPFMCEIGNHMTS